MKNMRSKALAAMTLYVAFAVTAAAPASAYTLMDMLQGRVKNGKVVDEGSSRNTTDRFAPPEARAPVVSNVDPEAATPKVTGPKYYTYKADAVRRISFKDQASVNVADSGMTTGSVSTALEPRAFLNGVNVQAPVTVADAVEAYYRNGGSFVWVENGAVTAQAKAAMDVLAKADAYGLDPADYAVREPVLTGDPQADAQALAAFEVALSARVLAYVEDAQRGRVDPNRISGYHDFVRKTVKLAPVLKILKSSPDVAAYLESRQPSSAHFHSLKAELARLKGMDGEGHHVVIELPRVLKPGGSDAELASVVEGIRLRGSDALKTAHAATLSGYAGTPDYTPELVALVKDLQKELGLKPDGIIGGATVRALVGDSNSAKIEKLVVAMEQARWLPNDFGSRYVFINQPAFTATYVNENKPQFDMRVVVGSKTNQTYFFQDEIETVEINPYWGVPQSIIVNEMLPKLRSDPSYLDRLGYQVAVNGKAVSSSAVNWYGSTNSVSVRQPPSSDNALGELKILFPNSHAIYMHDTPSKSFFKKDMRALSHGCVRLAEPRRMAAAVLGTTEDDIGKQIAAGQNRAIKAPEKIPVYVSYFTAWPDQNGVVHFYDDVYGRDAYVEKAFEATSKVRAAS